MKINKGMLMASDSCWYVVVEAIVNDKGVLGFNCICDHANNIHYIKYSEIHSYLTLKEIGNIGWELPDRVFLDREIPYEVIVEVLSGKHDDRFDHWSNE